MTYDAPHVIFDDQRDDDPKTTNLVGKAITYLMLPVLIVSVLQIACHVGPTACSILLWTLYGIEAVSGLMHLHNTFFGRKAG